MELWVRSQNKQLIRKANYEMCYNERNGHNYIVIDGDIVASYRTKERALEVLDEIEKYIEKQGTMEIDLQNGGKYYSKVYQMPKE